MLWESVEVGEDMTKADIMRTLIEGATNKDLLRICVEDILAMEDGDLILANAVVCIENEHKEISKAIREVVDEYL